MTRTLGIRMAVFFILHGLAWAFAMLIADKIWGDSVAQWMAVIFALVNGALVCLVPFLIRRKVDPNT